jgi:hypothetical protein
MEPGGESLERRFQAFNGILLLGTVETFVVHARDAQRLAHVAALRQECGLIPESVQVDVVIQRCRRTGCRRQLGMSVTIIGTSSGPG